MIKQINAQIKVAEYRIYLNYLEEHFNNVAKAYNHVFTRCEHAIDIDWKQLREQVMDHDMSKMSKHEFTQYANYYYGPSKHLGDAWEHHKTANHHHWQTAKTEVDIVHMIIDWVAMGYKCKDTAEKYYRLNRHAMIISDEHIKLMKDVFKLIKE